MRVAFLWHMHQPLYSDPVTDQPILPWVRLHATRAYFDMAWLLDRHEPIRCTVNFATVLLEQLDRAIAGVDDRFMELSLRSPADLSELERQFIVRNFFMVSWEHSIKSLPRYRELLEKRGRDLRQIDLKAATRQFSDAELGDLQLLFNLAWMGFAAHADYADLGALARKGSGFTREDMAYVAATQREIMRQIVPRYRKLAERGQVELAATPYYHPILPLLCDTDAARRALPEVVLPRRFNHPDDARWHVNAAINGHAQRFGAKPRGMWPAEGSVSPEALEIMASEGITWAASDEAVLMRSLPGDPSRGEVVYRPWIAQAGEREIRMLFRDRELSDLIGFTYAKTAPGAAVTDLVDRLHVIAKGQGVSAGERCVGIFLDGENPWENFAISGRDFLETLYERLEKDPHLKTATLSESTATATHRIDRIHSGSWIEASYRIWIGHAEDRAAWNALGHARAELEQARGKIDAARWEQARKHLLVAEGSDWFWWYGDDFVTDSSAEFDALFRGHVLEACRLLEVAPPLEARDAIKQLSAGSTDGTARPPRALISPVIDGRETHFFEWQGAGYFQTDASRGAMSGGEQLSSGLYYGFDLQQLYLRVDLVDARTPLAHAPTSPPTHLCVEMLDQRGEHRVLFPVGKGTSAVGAGANGTTGRCAVGPRGDIIELSLSFEELGVASGDRVSMSVGLLRGDVVAERLPRLGFFTVEIPDERFERIHWRA